MAVTCLVDIGGIPDSCCDDVLEDMAKAFADRPEGMWRPLENRWARATCEAFTVRVQSIINQMESALRRFLEGQPGALRKADVPWLRWDEARFEQTRNRLESFDISSMAYDDFELLIEYLIQRYLPPNVIEDLADFLSVRSALMGKIQANLETDRRVTDPMVDTIAALLPTTFMHVSPRVLTPRELSMMAYGRAHAGENIRHASEQMRHRLGVIAIEHVQAGMLGQREGTWKHAETRMFDEFAQANRDLRRIAVTEAGEMVNQGYITSLSPGQQVKRIEAYDPYVCDFCKSINGKVFTVVDPAKRNKDWQAEVWSGKTNIGRSASRMKRIGDHLVERTEDEMWAPASGVQHPHCRGSWIPVTDRPPEVSQEFFDWLNETLARVAVGM